jgi:hypothetical protein
VPAKPIRKMSDDELADIRKNAVEYVDLWHRDYRGVWDVRDQNHARRP